MCDLSPAARVGATDDAHSGSDRFPPQPSAINNPYRRNFWFYCASADSWRRCMSPLGVIQILLWHYTDSCFSLQRGAEERRGLQDKSIHLRCFKSKSALGIRKRNIDRRTPTFLLLLQLCIKCKGQNLSDGADNCQRRRWIKDDSIKTTKYSYHNIFENIDNRVLRWSFWAYRV